MVTVNYTCDGCKRPFTVDDVVYELTALASPDRPLWRHHFHWRCIGKWVKRG